MYGIYIQKNISDNSTHVSVKTFHWHFGIIVQSRQLQQLHPLTPE